MTACAFSDIASTLGIPSLLPFLKAVFQVVLGLSYGIG